MQNHFVDENVVMRFYLEEMAADRITFLSGRPAAGDRIASMIRALLEERRMNDRILIAKSLWKALFEAAMSSLDPNKQGYDRLFAYFDEYVEFEELIFASDFFYRDHTLHCIWVYFLGEYIARREEFACLFEQSQAQASFFRAVEQLMTDINRTQHSQEVEKLAASNAALRALERKQDAIRCVSALTHDLGYPLKKIEKINKSIHRVLPYYAVEAQDDFRFTYGTVSQHFIDAFLQVLSTNINVVASIEDPQAAALLGELLIREDHTAVGLDHRRLERLSEEEKRLLSRELMCTCQAVQHIRDRTRMCGDFEAYQHGIMSAFLLMKNVGAFQDLPLELRPAMDPASDTLENFWCKQQILRSITLHTCEAFHLRQVDGDSFLTLVDELEEFSRISRAKQSREYVEEFCSSQLYMDSGWFCIDFTFDNGALDSLDPGKAFRGRCKRLLTLLDIPRLDTNLKLRLRCFGELPWDQSVYQLELARHHVRILVDGVEQNIPAYLRSNQFYTSEEYALKPAE